MTGVAAFAAILAMSVLNACGGGNNDSTSAASTAAANGESGGGADIDGLAKLATTPPTEIPSLEPLPEPPPKGIKVVNLQCDFEACAIYGDTFKEAAKTLGWDLKTIVYKTGQPEAAMTQAVNSPGVEYVTISGISPDLIRPQIKEAGENGVTIILSADPAGTEPPTIPVRIAGPEGDIIQPAIALADYMIQDSKGTANVLNVGLPEIPITSTNGPAIKKRFEEKCPDCGFAELGVTGEELATGTVPANVIAYLQGHPEVTYVQVAFGGLLNGIPEAIKAAGLSDQIKIVGMQALAASEAASLKSGVVQAWYVAGQAEWGYLYADAISRIAMKLPLPRKIYDLDPNQHWLCTPRTAAECELWPGPAEALKQYEEVWQL